MKRTLKLLLLVVGITAIFFLFFVLKTTYFKKKTVYIAYAGPMSQGYGQDIANAIDMYLEKINDAGGIQGKKIELLRFDDQNDTEKAIQIAEQIVQGKKVLLVLGHYTSRASIAAGDIYDLNGVPAITASATSEPVTFGKRWYFRTVPNNKMEADLIANYLNLPLNQTSASIIFVENEYGVSLANDFEMAAKRLGISIKGKWGYRVEDPDLDRQLNRIIKNLKIMEDPVTLFLATDTVGGIKIISSLKESEKSHLIIGPDSFSKKEFLNRLKQLPQGQENPGYYSNGIICTSPFMVDIADENAYRFARQYLRQFKKNPSWSAACYYDAVHMAVEAMKKSDIDFEGRIGKNRKKVRDTLASFYNEKNAVNGITGDLYFDQNGDVNRPYALGVYQDQRLLPTFIQYKQIKDARVGKKVFKKVLNGEYIVLDRKLMSKFHVIYTDIELNRITNLNIENGVCTLDFYIWFLFSGDLDTANIEFTNSIRPVYLNKPVLQKTVNQVTMRVYHVKAAFNLDVRLEKYPYNSHVIPIRFRHGSQTDNRLIRVEHLSDLSDFEDRLVKRKTASVTVPPGWRVKEISLHRDELLRDIDIGDQSLFDERRMTYLDQYDVTVRIERDGWGHVIKIFYPLIIMLAVLYLICFAPPDRLSIRLLLSAVMLITIAIYHLRVLSDMPMVYTTPVEYGVFSLYVFAVMSIFLSIRIYTNYQKGCEKQSRTLVRAGKLIFPCLVFVLASLIAFMY